MSEEDVRKGGEDEKRRNDKDEDEVDDVLIMQESRSNEVIEGREVKVSKVKSSNQLHEQRQRQGQGQGQEQEEDEEQGQGQKQDKNLNIKKSSSSDKMLKRPGTRLQLVSSVLQSAATRVVMAGDYDCDSSVDEAFESMTFHDTVKRRGVGQVQGQSQSQAQIGSREGSGVKRVKEGMQERRERDGRGTKGGREGNGGIEGKGDRREREGQRSVNTVRAVSGSSVTRHDRPHDGRDRGSDRGRDTGSGRGREGSGRVEVSDSFSSASLSHIKNVKDRFPNMTRSVKHDSDSSSSSSSSSSTSHSHSSTSTSTSTSISMTSTSFAVPNAKKKKERSSKAAIARTTSISTSTNSSSTGNEYYLDQVKERGTSCLFSSFLIVNNICLSIHILNVR